MKAWRHLGKCSERVQDFLDATYPAWWSSETDNIVGQGRFVFNRYQWPFRAGWIATSAVLGTNSRIGKVRATLTPNEPTS